MRFDFHAVHEIQLAISKRVNQPACFLTSHAETPFASVSNLMRVANNVCSLCRPRASRDITVPIGKSEMIAISL